MLKVANLQAEIDGKQILKGRLFTVNAGDARSQVAMASAFEAQKSLAILLEGWVA